MLHLIDGLTADQLELINTHAHQAVVFAKKYSRKYRPLDRDEVLSAAYVGLMRAASLWDPGRENKGDDGVSRFPPFAWDWMRWSVANDRKNRYISYAHERSNPVALDKAESPEENDPDAVRAARLEKLHRLLKHVKPKHRDIVALRMQGYGCYDIARMMGCSRQNVSQILRRELSRETPFTSRLPYIARRSGT